MSEGHDIVIVGAGAAGLMTAVQAGRAAPDARILLVDGARRPGAKILVAGGGRCNVTHERVDARDFAGSTRPAIAKVLRNLDVPETIRFFHELGVELKREETGKLFPTTDRARTVLDALFRAVAEAGVEFRHPFRVENAHHTDDGLFQLVGPQGELRTRRMVLATGGKSLPKSGSDGRGFEIATALGHSLTSRIFPALVPLLLPNDHPLTTLSGIATPARLEVRSGGGRRLTAFEGPVLCTHFGLSGPCVLDVSRYYLDALAEDRDARLVVSWLPSLDRRTVDADLVALSGRSPMRWLTGHLPQRFAALFCREAGIDPEGEHPDVSRDARRRLVASLVEQSLPVTGDRGWTYAEVTAGGVPLSEVNLATMASRRTPGLYLCGEILDVDGRIGGFNFQWAWASGTVAGRGVAASVD